MTNWFAGAATLIVGFYAGWVSMRTSRRLPHDQLKQLSDIRHELGSLDREHVIDAAIARELRSLKRLTDAREVGPWRYAIEWASQRPVSAVLASLAPLFAGAGVFYLYMHYFPVRSLAWSWVAAGVIYTLWGTGFLILFAIACPGYVRLFRRELELIRHARVLRKAPAPNRIPVEDGPANRSATRHVHRSSPGLQKPRKLPLTHSRPADNVHDTTRPPRPTPVAPTAANRLSTPVDHRSPADRYPDAFAHRAPRHN